MGWTPRRLLVAAAALLLALAMLTLSCSTIKFPTLAPTGAAPAATPTTVSSSTEATMPSEKPTEKPASAPSTPPVAKPAGKPIKIGFITPLTGRFAGYGARQKIAVQLAVDDVNKAEGINGSLLEVITLDDAANPRETVTLVRRLATEDKVTAIIGPLTNASFEVAAPLANELKVPLATTSATKLGITDKNRPWVFRFAGLDSTYTPRAIEGYKKLYPNVRKMVISGDTKDAVNENIVKNNYPKALKDAGLEVVESVLFESVASDFSAIVTKIKRLNPEGIAYSSLTPEAIGFAREVQRQGIKAPVVASSQNWGGPEIFLGKDVLDGWVVSGAFDEDAQDPLSKSFTERFARIGVDDPAVGKPAYAGNGANAYDAVLALAEVMRKAQITSDVDIQKARTAIQEGLLNLKGFKGLMGEINMQPNGDISTNSMAFVARNGKWTLIK